MAPELRLQHRLSHQLVMTPQLQQAIKLLALSHLEMATAISEEATANPILELAEPSSPAQTVTSDAPESPQTTMWEGWGQQATAAGVFSQTPFESRLACQPTLADALLWQLTMAPLSDQERFLTGQIVDEIQDTGRLAPDTIERLAESTQSCEQDVAAALAIVQDLDPPGIAARSLPECLNIQARRLWPKYAGLIETILAGHLSALERRQTGKIARALRVAEQDVAEAIVCLRRLNPHPGLLYGEREVQAAIPDVFVRRRGDAFEVVLNEDDLPRLQIHPDYAGRLSERLDDSTRLYVQEKVKQAHFFLRSIAMRSRTLIRVTESIVLFQKEFFEKGPKYLKPLVMRDVASKVELHESTISRVTTNKYVHTPMGIFELKYFFNSAIRALEGEGLASEAVRGHIARLVSQEDAAAPYSDQRLVEILRAQDVDIARRTVAKYREMLNIPSSSRRRRPPSRT